MKGSQSQVVTSRPDAKSQSYIDQLRSRGLSYANQNQFGGPNQSILDALQGFRGYSQAGQSGAAALSGDASAASRFMNPYFATLDPLFAKLSDQASRAASQDATRYGAFGGSRADVARGVARSNVANQQAQLGYQGFNDAMSRAAQAANLGFGADQAQYGAGQYLQFLPQLFQQGQLGLLNSALGPTGTTQETQMSSSPLQQLFGAGLSIAPFFFPPAGAATAAMGAGSAGYFPRVAGKGAFGI